MTDKPKDPGRPKTPQEEAETDAIAAMPIVQKLAKEMIDEKPIEKPLKNKRYWRI